MAGASLRGDHGEAVCVHVVGDGCGLAVVAGQHDEACRCVDRVLGDLPGDGVGVALVHRLGAALIPGLVAAGVAMGLDLIALHRADLGEVEMIELEEVGTEMVDDTNDDRGAVGQLGEGGEQCRTRPDMREMVDSVIDQPAERGVVVVGGEQHGFAAWFERVDQGIEVAECRATGAGVDQFRAADVPPHRPVVAGLARRRQLRDHRGVRTRALVPGEHVGDPRQLVGGPGTFDLCHASSVDPANSTHQRPRSRSRRRSGRRPPTVRSGGSGEESRSELTVVRWRWSRSVMSTR